MAEDFYKDSAKVEETFSEIKELQSKSEKLNEDWIDLSLKIE